MPSAYPASLDSFPTPTSSTYMDDTGFEGDVLMEDALSATEAIETKLGTGAGAPPGAAAVLRRTATGASGWGQVAAGDYAAGSISGNDIGNLGIINGKYAVGSIATGDIAANAVSVSGHAVGTSGVQTTGSTTYIDMPDMVATIVTSETDTIIALLVSANSNSGTNNTTMALSLDAATEVGDISITTKTGGTLDCHVVAFRWAGVAAGTHTVKGRLKVSGGTTTMFGNQRFLLMYVEKK